MSEGPIRRARGPIPMARWTLRFAHADVEASFLDAYARGSQTFFRFALGTVSVMFLGIAPIDVAVYHNPSLALARGVAAPCLLASLLLGFARVERFARWWQLAGTASYLTVGLVAVLQSTMVEEAYRQKDICLGICLITVGCHTLIFLRFAYASLASLVIFPAYLVTCVVTAMPVEQTLTNGAWVVTATLMGMMGSYLIERRRRGEFLQSHLLAEERALSERLLLNVLPERIARRLRAEEGAIADSHEEVTVLFADLVGFTPLSERMSPHAIVRALDEVFSAFDDAAQRHGVEKIKTVGDAYMAAGGLLSRSENDAAAVARMALEMLAFIDDYRLPGGGRLQIRVGMHTGHVVAGVIGKKKFSYDLWGDTVNVASRMESHGVPGAVQLSEATRDRLADLYPIEARGELEIKGKGKVRAFLLRRPTEEERASTPGP